MPKHLCSKSDNTTSQANNSLAGQVLAYLEGAGHFGTCTLNVLPVGHTHGCLDLVCGISLAHVLRRYRVQCPEELCTLIEIGMADWAAKYGLACHCTVRDMILDFRGGWTTRAFTYTLVGSLATMYRRPTVVPTNAGMVSQIQSSLLPQAIASRMIIATCIAASSTGCKACIQTMLLYLCCNELGWSACRAHPHCSGEAHGPGRTHAFEP